MNAFTRFHRTVRFLLFNFISWVVVIPMAMLVLLAWPFSVDFAYRIGRSWGLFCLWVMRRLCGLDYRIRWEGEKPEESCVFMFKHSSAFETFGSLEMFPRVTWVLKKDLIYVPFFGWTMIPLDGIAIDRGKGRKSVEQIIELGTDRLERGISVIIYPEGIDVKKYDVSSFIYTVCDVTVTDTVPDRLLCDPRGHSGSGQSGASPETDGQAYCT